MSKAKIKTLFLLSIICFFGAIFFLMPQQSSQTSKGSTSEIHINTMGPSYNCSPSNTYHYGNGNDGESWTEGSFPPWQTNAYSYINSNAAVSYKFRYVYNGVTKTETFTGNKSFYADDGTTIDVGIISIPKGVWVYFYKHVYEHGVDGDADYHHWTQYSSTTGFSTTLRDLSVNDLKYEKGYDYTTLCIVVGLYGTGSPTDYRKTITYNSNGGTGSMSSQKVVPAFYETLPSCSFSKACYGFSCWKLNSSGTGRSYYSSSEYLWTSDTTLYAVWTPITYTISFDGNGSTSGEMNQLTVNFDTAVQITNAFTRDGYTFAGWKAGDIDSTARYGSNSSYATTTLTTSTLIPNNYYVKNLRATQDANATLTAQWNPITYKLSFNGNGATSGTMSLEDGKIYGTSFTLTANKFSKTGWTFAGWATSPTGNVVYSDCQSVSNLTTTDGGTALLYAKWTPNTFTIVFNKNGGSGGSMANQTFSYDTAQNLTANGFSKTGYKFAGWATTSTGNVVYSNGQSVSNLTTTNDGTIYLYAKWTAITYSVAFNSNGGSGSMETLVDKVYDSSFILPYNAFTRSGYIFLGWSKTSSDTIPTHRDGEQVSNLSITDSSTVQLYAIWQKSHNIAAPTVGNGLSESTAYVIDSAAKLAWLSEQVASGNTTFFAKQTANIDLSSSFWKPIGTALYRFTGSFDGQGYTISGLKTSIAGLRGSSDFACSNVGMFGFVGADDRNAIIKNVNLINAIVSGYKFVGGLAGDVYGKVTIQNCNVQGELKGLSYVGGLAGSTDCQNTSNKPIIENCNADVTITATGDAVGGFAGFIGKTTISNCHASANITALGACDIGGFVGVGLGSEISGCTAAGSVTGYGDVGGFIGTVRAVKKTEVTNCYASVNITAEDSVGGFIGCSVGSNLTISKCVYYGKGYTLRGIPSYTGLFLGRGSSTYTNISDCLVVTDSAKNFYNNKATVSNCIYYVNGVKNETNASFDYTNWSYISYLGIYVPKGLMWIS